MATIKWVVTYSPFGHRSRSSTSTLPPPSWMGRVAQGSGHPGAVDVARDEGLQRLAVLLRSDAHVAAAGLVGLQAVLLEPGSKGVLRVAQAGRGQRLALQILDAVDLRLDDQEGPAGRGAGDDPRPHRWTWRRR